MTIQDAAHDGTDSFPAPAERWKRLAVLMASTSAALLAACVFLLWRGRHDSYGVNTQAALDDPALRDEIVEQLTASSAGVWDSHNDPEVGRVLQPNLKDKPFTGVPMKSNSLGLREHYFALPKPAGTLRVVLLGDSFVHGFGVAANERMGAFLERALREHASGWSGTIECLHIGIGGWNAIAECAYLRRMLTELAPDLVIHIVVTNDLDDQAGVRGFGQLSSFAPLAPLHADALVSHAYPTRFSTPRNTNYLLLGADHESRHRFQAAGEAIVRLDAALERVGSRYLLFVQWPEFCTRLWHYLQPALAPEQVYPIPKRVSKQADLVLSPSDPHWSRKGHQVVANLLFALIREHGLLPELALTPNEGEETARAELARVQAEALGKPALWRPVNEALSSLEPASFTELEWRHVYTGLDEAGLVSPFASFHLRCKPESKTLRLRGHALPRTELAGARTRVFVEGILVGEHSLVPGAAFDVTFPLPEAVPRGGGISVRLETDDYGYTGQYQQHCVSFALEQLAVE